jgi:hypothetical protein
VTCPTCRNQMFIEDPIWGGPNIYRCRKCLNELPMDYEGTSGVRGSSPASHQEYQGTPDRRSKFHAETPEEHAARFEYILGNCSKGTCGG